jgi:hypothetical protein
MERKRDEERKKGREEKEFAKTFFRTPTSVGVRNEADQRGWVHEW